MPEVATTLAITVLLLLQLPPLVASPSKVTSPTHISETPVIKAGKGLTVTIADVAQLPSK
jgi:hypothetical protein